MYVKCWGLSYQYMGKNSVFVRELLKKYFRMFFFVLFFWELEGLVIALGLIFRSSVEFVLSVH